MALDKRVDKARNPHECVNCECMVQRGETYWLVPKPTKAPAVVYCVVCYLALPPYFKHTTRGL